MVAYKNITTTDRGVMKKTCIDQRECAAPKIIAISVKLPRLDFILFWKSAAIRDFLEPHEDESFGRASPFPHVEVIYERRIDKKEGLA